MGIFSKSQYANTFLEWGIRQGYQTFFTPNTVPLPTGITLNPYGWLPAPSNTDLLFPFVEIRPNESRTLYWFSQEIVTNSDNEMRLSLETNRAYNETTGTFDDAEENWFTIAGYTVRNSKDMAFNQTLGMYKISHGQSLRLRCFPITGNNNDWYFRFGAIDLPWNE